jgi:choline kinase
MKAIILAAGRGTRLEPLTNNIPKCLIEVNGKSILKSELECLEKNGIEETVVVVGYLKDKIIKKFGDGFGQIEIRYIENPIHQDTGDAFSLQLAKDELKGDVIIIDGDVLFGEELIRRLMDTPYEICLAIDKKRVSERETKVKMAQSNKIIDIIRGGSTQGKCGRYIGIAKIGDESLLVFTNKLANLIKNNNNLKNIVYSQAILMMIKKGYDVYGIDMSDLLWAEIDTSEDLEYAKRTFRR